jgi:hypothetical protein
MLLSDIEQTGRTGRHTGRQTDRQADQEAGGPTGRQTDGLRQADGQRQTARHAGKQTDQKDKPTADSLIDKLADRQKNIADRRAGRWTESWTGETNKQTRSCRQTDRLVLMFRSDGYRGWFCGGWGWFCTVS